MKKSIITTLIIIVVLVTFFALVGNLCIMQAEKENIRTQEIKIASGFDHSFPLLKIDEDEDRGLKGFLDGSFFLGCGSVEGRLTQGDELTVYWKKSQKGVEVEIIKTCIPYEKIIFILSEIEEPKIEFVLYENWAHRWKSLPENPNRVIGEELKMAKIWITTLLID